MNYGITISLYSSLEPDCADSNDYLDVASHDVDRQEELEYEVRIPEHHRPFYYSSSFKLYSIFRILIHECTFKEELILYM